MQPRAPSPLVVADAARPAVARPQSLEPAAPLAIDATGTAGLLTRDGAAARADRLLGLQRVAGNQAVRRLLTGTTQHVLQRDDSGAATTAAPAADPTGAPAPPTPVRHELKQGDGPSVEIGELQQALNVTTAGTLRITGFFSPETAASVLAFQLSHNLTPAPPATAGQVDLKTWAELDKLAPRRMRQGREVVEGPAEGDPRSPPKGGNVHPTVRRGSTGPEVEELQKKLNTIPPDQVPTMLEADGKFGGVTRQAVIEFQKSRTPPLKDDGVVGPLTWASLDLVAGPVDVGRERYESFERVEGSEYGGTASFTWRVHPDRMEVTVNMKFTGAPNHPRVAAWRNDIVNVWNRFKFVDQANPGTELPLRFVVGTGAPTDATVRVVVTPPNAKPGRSDMENWHTGDLDPGLAPHEFGHLIGLDDEYNRAPEQYAAATGEQPLIGIVDAPKDSSGNPVAPETIAAEIRAAVTSSPSNKRAEKTKAVVRDKYSLRQGGFATRVAQAYETSNIGNMQREDLLPGGAAKVVSDIPGTIANDIAARIPGRPADEMRSVSPFLVNNRSIMGTMESLTSPIDAHDHPVAPRHLRHFRDLLARARPGTWKIVEQ